MRLVPIECVKEDSLLGKTIYDIEGRTLLKPGVKLTTSLISKIKELNIFSLYIVDDYSDYEIEDIIKPELRQKAIKTIRQTFTDIERVSLAHDFKKRSISDYSKKEQDYFASINSISEELLDNILSNKHLLVSLVDIKNMDSYTYQHSVNVAVLSLVLGISLKLPKYKLIELCTGALLHDIGKTFIDSGILQKPGRLTEYEFSIIKQHPIKGYDFLSSIYDFNSNSKLIILQHHERIDGLGYPYGIKDNKINYMAKISSIADVYDALTSDRPYKRAMCPGQALEYLMANTGTFFDYELVKVFSRVLVPFPNGTIVSLSNGEIGIVEENFPNFPLRPSIKVLKSIDKNNIGSHINLLDELSIVISDIEYST
ncbi:HD-GYP domain-containing protein [Clostridium uliginosum]|uniref:HD-GYP domain, c-di-GMP phosphodiesterase class II (Or its inactivated variant) n=1 Tax=Clostridium uliginosum TaxID=119641 RepID=A0A1I1LGW8_9CLOT|nr:HD-GYP domain-containing protein [Clostridium uliginosum]SFC68750.1 HD-GYP domain, c-di-GMP phosphodiesterase class II (or its inactivated variant) [Clostridium uliginosum]